MCCTARRAAGRAERAAHFPGPPILASACWLLAAALLCGCDLAAPSPQRQEARSSGERGSVPQEAVASPQPEWSRLVALVKQGESLTIRADAPVSDPQLSDLVGLEQLEELHLDRAEVTDEGLRHLSALSDLRRLTIRGAKITDRGVDSLLALKQLRSLNIPQADLSDEGFRRLSELPRLELLRLGSPRLTDAALESVPAFPKLRFLHLIDVPVTDRGLRHLHGLQRLESLYLDGARASDQGVVALLEASPDLHLHLDQLHHDRDPRKHDHGRPR